MFDFIQNLIWGILLFIILTLVNYNSGYCSSDAGTNNSIGRGSHSYSQIVEPNFKVENNSGFTRYSKTIKWRVS